MKDTFYSLFSSTPTTCSHGGVRQRILFHSHPKFFHNAHRANVVVVGRGYDPLQVELSKSVIDQSLAALSVAPLFTRGKLERWIARLFLTYSFLGTTSVLGYAFHSLIILVGFIAWGPVLGVTVILLGFMFWRDSRTQRKNA